MRYRFYRGLALFGFVLLIGTVGFFAMGSYTWIDAFFMTMITITTVGYSEVQPLDDTGKIFTIVLLLMSIGVYGYLVSIISEFFSNNKFMENVRNNRQIKKIEKLEGHTIICGFGRNGRQAFDKLKSYHNTCVVIEKNPENINEEELEGVVLIKGDATNDKILEDAGIKNAKNLITALPSDADNLYVVLSARQMSKSLNIVSRATVDQTHQKLMIAGANHVIMPDKLGGDYMASLLVTPDLVEFVKRISMEGEKRAHLEEIEVNKLPENYLLKSIRDLDVRRKTGCNVIGFITEDERYIVNPESEIVLKPNSRLIVLGRPDQIQKFNHFFENTPNIA